MTLARTLWAIALAALMAAVFAVVPATAANAAVANDDQSGAIAITKSRFAQDVSTATFSSAEQALLDGCRQPRAGAGVTWYSYTVPASAKGLVIDTSKSNAPMGVVVLDDWLYPGTCRIGTAALPKQSTAAQTFVFGVYPLSGKGAKAVVNVGGKSPAVQATLTIEPTATLHQDNTVGSATGTIRCSGGNDTIVYTSLYQAGIASGESQFSARCDGVTRTWTSWDTGWWGPSLFQAGPANSSVTINVIGADGVNRNFSEAGVVELR